MKQHSHSSNLGSLRSSKVLYRRSCWINAIMDRELSELRRLPVGTNINRPGCQFWKSIFSIAGLVRGRCVRYDVALANVKDACNHVNKASDKEVEYQFGRAFQRAKPKHFQP